MPLDASFDSFDSYGIADLARGRADTRERPTAAGREQRRDASAPFRMAIDRSSIDDAVFAALMSAAWVIVASGVAWALLPLLVGTS